MPTRSRQRAHEETPVAAIAIGAFFRFITPNGFLFLASDGVCAHQRDLWENKKTRLVTLLHVTCYNKVVPHGARFIVSCFIKVVPHVARIIMLDGPRRAESPMTSIALLPLRGVHVDLGLVFF